MAQVVVVSFLLPLAVGMALHAALGQAAERLAKVAETVGFAVLVVFVLLIVVAKGATIFPLLGGSAVVVVLFAAGSVLIGHVLGGPDPQERVSLAIATVTRHPGLALLMAATNFPRTQDLASAIIAFVLGMALATLPYMAWQKRRLSLQPRPPVSSPAGVR